VGGRKEQTHRSENTVRYLLMPPSRSDSA